MGEIVEIENDESEINIWSGQQIQPIYNLDASLGHLILNVFKLNPNHVAQINADTDKRTTCYEMRLRVARIATSLENMGFKKGDIVGVMGTNSEYLAALAFACFVLGLPVNSLSPTFNKADIVHMLGITRPKIIFCDFNCLDVMEDSLAEIELHSPVFTILERVDSFRFLEDLLEETGNEEEFE